MLKKIVFFLLIITVFSATSFNAFATDATSPNSTILKVGYVKDYGGIRDMDAIIDKGYLYDLFKRMEDFCDYTFEFVEYTDFDALIAGLYNKECNYFGPIIKTSRGVNTCTQTLELTDAVISLVAKSDNIPHYYNNPQSIDGKTVAIYESNGLEPYLNDYCKENNISVKYVYAAASDYDDVDADFYLTSSNYHNFDNYISVVNLATCPFYVGTTSKNTEINNNVEKAFLSVKTCDAGFLYELHEKYYAGTASQRRTLTREEAKLLQDFNFTIGFNSKHDFFSYLNKDGEPDGFLINLSKKVFSIVNGKEIKYLPYHLNGEGEHSVEYAVENADIIVSAMGNVNDFKDDFTLTDTFIEIPSILLLDEELYYNNDKTVKARIGVIRNMFMKQNDITEAAFNEEIIIYDDIPTLFSDFNGDKIDGFYISEWALCCVREFTTRSYFASAFISTTAYKLWISNKLGRDFVTIANVIFDHIDTHIADELMLKEQEKYKIPPDLIEVLKANLDIIAFVVSLVILIFSTFIILIQRKKSQAIKEILEVDTLTGLMTRYKFIHELKNIFKTAKPNEYLLMAFDIDDFKIINITYGRKNGDKILCTLSAVLSEYTESLVCISRLHSDNFVTLIRNRQDTWSRLQQLTENNNNFVDNVKNRFVQELKKINVERNVYFSIGVYIIENPLEKINYMIDCADRAKNIGKNTFGNTLILHTEEIQKSYDIRIEILSTMEDAIDHEEFFIVIQPKVELNTGKLIGGEVLIRWKKSDDSFIYPDEFIPLFESNNFIVRLDHYVLEKTCEFIHNAKIDLPIISINVSAATMLREKFIDTYIEILQKYSISPQQIELELTESILNTNYVEILAVIKKLKNLGFTIAIDDFGKGASSLARIRELDIDVLKLDKEFIDDNVSSEKGKLVLRNIISMGNGLGFMTLAEGVETKEQQEMLIDLGCRYAQGYYFDKPLPLDVMLEKIADSHKQHTL